MAIASSASPMLRIKRSTQSGSKTMTAAYAAVYTESSSQPYIFAGAVIDLSTMIAGNIINIRVRKMLASGAAWVLVDEMTYTGAQPTGHPAVYIQGLANFFGIEISMRQTAGVLTTVTAEFIDAKRIGLE